MGLAKLTVGRNKETNEFVHIDYVERGLACNCICSKCKSQLIARKGQKTVHHFAHYHVEECNGAWETALHQYAKQVLHEESKIRIPFICVKREYREDIHVQEAQLYVFEAVELEKNFGTFQPDAMITRPHCLFIEFAVTHFSDDKKISKLVQHGVSAIEIDLSKVEGGLNDNQLREYIINDAPRVWLYSLKKERELSRIIKEEKANVRKAAKEEIRRAKEKEHMHEGVMASMFLEMQDIIEADFLNLSTITGGKWNPMLAVEKLDLLECCNYQPSTPDIFNVEPKAWQSAIIYSFIVKPVRERDFKNSKFSEEDVYYWLHRRGFLPNLFSHYFDAIYLMEYANTFSNYGHGPANDVTLYLKYLVKRKLLWKDKIGYYRVSKFHPVLQKVDNEL